jgi:hypothetical protein
VQLPLCAAPDAPLARASFIVNLGYVLSWRRCECVPRRVAAGTRRLTCGAVVVVRCRHWLYVRDGGLRVRWLQRRRRADPEDDERTCGCAGRGWASVSSAAALCTVGRVVSTGRRAPRPSAWTCCCSTSTLRRTCVRDARCCMVPRAGPTVAAVVACARVSSKPCAVRRGCTIVQSIVVSSILGELYSDDAGASFQQSTGGGTSQSVRFIGTNGDGESCAAACLAPPRVVSPEPWLVLACAFRQAARSLA